MTTSDRQHLIALYLGSASGIRSTERTTKTEDTMTFKETITKNLENSGLWPDEAKAIFSKIEADPANEAMRGRWNEDTSGYPAVMLNVLALTTKTNAHEWLLANKPQHWALPMFA